MSLIDIAKKYPTSKNDHEYIQFYETYFHNFRNKDINILEIGIERGDSLRMWREYFTKAKICAIDILDRNISVDNTDIMIGDQSNLDFLKKITDKYGKFDIIIDDGSHLAKDVKKSFELLFPSLKENGLYVIEDIQTSYNHFFGGNPFDLKYSNSHMNFFKQLTDSLNYQEIANPFYIEKKYDGKITNISFYHNMVFVRKGNNDKPSREVIKHSYEDMKFLEKSERTGKKLQYFVKYKIFYKLYTLLLFVLNTLKKLILFRI